MKIVLLKKHITVFNAVTEKYKCIKITGVFFIEKGKVLWYIKYV